MKNAFKILLFAFFILTILNSCEEACNTCLELTTKEIKYVDRDGNNLLFGNKAIYHPDSVIIKDGADNEVHFWRQEGPGTILFNLEDMVYYIMLSDSLTDTLEFELAERKSMSCCGNVMYSRKTRLNGQDIENDDLLIITR